MRLLVLAQLGLVLAATSVRAQPLEAVLLPSAPLAADGERVHALRLYLVAGDALASVMPTVTAARGAIVTPPSRTSDGGVAFAYRPPRVTAPAADALTVTAGAQRLKLSIALEPAGRIRLTIDAPEAAILIGRGAKTSLRLHARDAAGRPVRAALRVSASIGEAAIARELAAGEYELVYRAPDKRYPEVAIVSALSVSDGAFVAVPLKLAARVSLAGEGEPGASMRISVDGREFPAVTIGADGRFSVPLVVPPGGRALGVSVDKLGNEKRRAIDLALPPFPRLILSAVPATLPANGTARAEVVAFAVDARGNPERRAPPELAADAGTLSAPTPHGDGSTTWTFTAPAALSWGGVALSTTLAKKGRARERASELDAAETRIALTPGPPRSIELVAPGARLPAGADAPVTVDVRVRDAAGSPVGGASLSASLAGGRVVGAHEKRDGVYAIELLPPPDLGRATAQLHVEVTAVKSGAPRQVSLHPVAGGAEAWIDDDVGLPVVGEKIELAGPDLTERVETDRYGTAALRFSTEGKRSFRVTAQPLALPGLKAALDYLVVGGVAHVVGSVVGSGVTGAREPPSFPALDAAVPLEPLAPLDLRLYAEPATAAPGQTVRVRVEVRGGKAAKLVYEASGGRLDVTRALDAGKAELGFRVPADARAGDRYFLSATDAKTRVTAVGEVTVR